MPKLRIKIDKLLLFAETTHENPATVKAVLARLPIKGKVQRWGEEIYFAVPFDIAEERQRQDAEPGEIAFWPEGPAIAIFFGKTPASQGSKPRAYSPCNFFAKLIAPFDKAALNSVGKDAKIVIDRENKG